MPLHPPVYWLRQHDARTGRRDYYRGNEHYHAIADGRHRRNHNE